MKKKSLSDTLGANRRTFGSFFFGFGLAIFTINIAAMISLLPHIKRAGIPLGEPLLGYYISLLSSLFIMSFALYNYFKGKDD